MSGLARLFAVALLLAATTATPAHSAAHAGVRTGGSDEQRAAVSRACPPTEVFEDGFLDVSDGSTHDFAIDCLSWWQVTAGTGVGTYAPAEPVSRGQMATLLANALARGGVALPASTSDAFDDDDGSVHAENIDALAAAGVVLGRVDGTYGPTEHVSRAQMASYLAAALGFATGAALPPGTDVFDDDDGSVHEHNINAVASAGWKLTLPRPS